jgi:N-acyl-D-aspartate/D-glutamate deacylase
MRYDILIKDGKIIDGTGNPWFKADLGIKDSKIVYIGRINKYPKTANDIIDAKGLFVSPGFIDIHTHADLTVMPYPGCESSVFQGVTSSVVGNCGWSLAPLNNFNKKLVQGYFSPFLFKDFEYGWDWESFGDYYEKISKLNFTMNLIPLVGQGTIRIAVKGFSQQETSKKELKEMRFLLENALKEGAFGLSAGLGYPPGGYSRTEELVDLTKVLKKYDAIFSCHIRDYGNLLENAVLEMIRIGKENDIPILISHLVVKGEKNWGYLVHKVLKKLENSRAQGIEVYCDRYPYTAGCSTITQLLPLWALEGGTEKMLTRLQVKNDREEIKKDIIRNRVKENNGIQEVGLDQIVLNDVPGNPSYEGKSLQEIVAEKGELDNAYDSILDIILELEGKVTQVKHFAFQEDVDAVITHPLSMVMSDGWLTNIFAKGKPHPRNFGTFPKFLNQYVKEKKLLTWEDAIRKITSMPATVLRLKDRGLIKEGFVADISIFDEDKIIDTATYQNPKQYPRGIEYVIVNGKLTVKNRKILDARNGSVLRKI